MQPVLYMDYAHHGKYAWLTTYPTLKDANAILSHYTDTPSMVVITYLITPSDFFPYMHVVSRQSWEKDVRYYHKHSRKHIMT